MVSNSSNNNNAAATRVVLILCVVGLYYTSLNWNLIFTTQKSIISDNRLSFWGTIERKNNNETTTTTTTEFTKSSIIVIDDEISATTTTEITTKASSLEESKEESLLLSSESTIDEEKTKNSSSSSSSILFDSSGHIVNISSTMIQQDNDNKNEPLPVVGRWRHRFGKKNGGGGGYIFFKHIRKAGGTSIREYLYNVYMHHKTTTITNNTNTETNEQQKQQQESLSTTKGNNKVKINFYEQEFCAMDRNCPIIDKRWSSTLSIVVLRHPIERHMSEFFYSGPGKKKQYKGQFTNMIKNNNNINAGSDGVINNEKNNNVTETFRSEVKEWIQLGLSKNPDIGRHFSDNFQTRVLSGQTDVGPTEPSSSGVVQENCVFQNFNVDKQGNVKLPVTKIKNKYQCIGGADVPCKYGSGGTHTKQSCFGGGIESSRPYNVTLQDQQAAIQVLDGFDVVLITESMGESEISNYLSDVTGLPISDNSAMPHSKKGTSVKVSKKLNNNNNTNNQNNNQGDDDEEEEGGEAEGGDVHNNAKTHLYRNFLQSQTPDLYELLEYHTRYEIPVYEHAVKLYKESLSKWRTEKDNQQE